MFLTAVVTPGEADKLHGRNAGDRLLAKPVSTTELVACLLQELAKHATPAPGQINREVQRTETEGPPIWPSTR